LKSELRERTLGYVVAAFGIVAGLAWNDAVKSLIEYVFPGDKNSLIVKFIYAVIITVLVVVVTTMLMRFAKKESQEEKKK
jgi:lysylphosphatidylglycerol synthetase-like protein (DUF2156 family)